MRIILLLCQREFLEVIVVHLKIWLPVGILHYVHYHVVDDLGVVRADLLL